MWSDPLMPSPLVLEEGCFSFQVNVVIAEWLLEIFSSFCNLGLYDCLNQLILLAIIGTLESPLECLVHFYFVSLIIG